MRVRIWHRPVEAMGEDEIMRCYVRMETLRNLCRENYIEGDLYCILLPKKRKQVSVITITGGK